MEATQNGSCCCLHHLLEKSADCLCETRRDFVIHSDDESMELRLNNLVVVSSGSVVDALSIWSKCINRWFQLSSNLVDTRRARDEKGQRSGAVQEPAQLRETTAAQPFILGFTADETMVPMPNATMVVRDISILLL